MKKIGEQVIKNSSTYSETVTNPTKAEIHVSVEPLLGCESLPISEIIAPLPLESPVNNSTTNDRFEIDFEPVKKEQESSDEYNLYTVRMSPKVETGQGTPISKHETEHLIIMKEEASGKRTYSTLLTSSTHNSVDKTKNEEVDALNVSGQEKPQRIAYLQETRMLDPDVKENNHYNVDAKGSWYINQEHIIDKVERLIDEREKNGGVPVIRRAENDSSLFNELGHKQEDEHVNTDFTDKNNTEHND